MVLLFPLLDLRLSNSKIAMSHFDILQHKSGSIAAFSNLHRRFAAHNKIIEFPIQARPYSLELHVEEIPNGHFLTHVFTVTKKGDSAIFTSQPPVEPILKVEVKLGKLGETGLGMCVEARHPPSPVQPGYKKVREVTQPHDVLTFQGRPLLTAVHNS